jgi:hypothetical protein
MKRRERVANLRELSTCTRTENKKHSLPHGHQIHGVKSLKHILLEVGGGGGGWIESIGTLSRSPALLDKVELAMEFREEEHIEAALACAPDGVWSCHRT